MLISLEIRRWEADGATLPLDYSYSRSIYQLIDQLILVFSDTVLYMSE